MELWCIKLQDEQNLNDVEEAVGPVLSLDIIRVVDNPFMINDPLGRSDRFGNKEGYLRIFCQFLDLQEGMQSLLVENSQACSRKDRLSLRDVDPDVDWNFLRPVPQTV